MTALPTSPPPDGRPSASLHFVVGEMSGKLDQLMLSVAPALALLTGKVEKVEEVVAGFVPRSEIAATNRRLDERITTLEKWYWGFLGVISAGGALWAVIEQGPHIVALLKVS